MQIALGDSLGWEVFIKLHIAERKFKDLLKKDGVLMTAINKQDIHIKIADYAALGKYSEKEVEDLQFYIDSIYLEPLQRKSLLSSGKIPFRNIIEEYILEKIGTPYEKNEENYNSFTNIALVFDLIAFLSNKQIDS